MTYGFATALALAKNFQQLVFSLLSSGSTDFFLTMFAPFSYFSLGTIQKPRCWTNQIEMKFLLIHQGHFKKCEPGFTKICLKNTVLCVRTQKRFKFSCSFCLYFCYIWLVKKDSNMVRSFYLLFEGAVTCRVLFVDTTLATTALSKYV